MKELVLEVFSLHAQGVSKEGIAKRLDPLYNIHPDSAAGQLDQDEYRERNEISNAVHRLLQLIPETP